MKLPVCENPKCQQVIYDDHYYLINGEILCQECMEAEYMMNTEDFEIGQAEDF